MPISTSSRVLVASAAIALLAGCSGGSATSPISSIGSQSISRQNARPAQALTHAQIFAKTLLVKPGLNSVRSRGPIDVTPPANFKGIIFASDVDTNEVYKVTTKGKSTSVGSGWEEPQGIGVDSKGDVFVADTVNSRIVEMSKAGKPVAILSDPGQYPAGVAIAADGTVGVTNIISTSGGAGSVSFYKKGKTSPECTESGVLADDYFIGVDSKDNFFFDGFNASTGAITLATTTVCGTISDTGLSGPTDFPGGVQVYESGRGKKAVETIGWSDQSELEVYQFSDPGFTPGPAVFLGGGSDEVEFALTKNRKYVVSGDAGNGDIAVWAWPAGGATPLFTIGGFGEPVGIAITPTGDE